MMKNMGWIDRSIRALDGLALIVIGVISGFWWMYILAVIMLLTSAVGICPLYLPFKIKTLTKKERENEKKDCC